MGLGQAGDNRATVSGSWLSGGKANFRISSHDDWLCICWNITVMPIQLLSSVVLASEDTLHKFVCSKNFWKCGNCTLNQLTDGANSSSRIVPQVLLSPCGYPQETLIVSTGLWFETHFWWWSWSTFVFLLATITCVNMAAWTSRDMQVLSCRASNLYGQSWNETIMMVFRIVQAFPESYTCTMTVTLAMAANWKQKAFTVPPSRCVWYMLGSMHNSDHNGYHVVRIFIHLYILGTLFLLCIMLENL